MGRETNIYVPVLANALPSPPWTAGGTRGLATVVIRLPTMRGGMVRGAREAQHAQSRAGGEDYQQVMEATVVSEPLSAIAPRRHARAQAASASATCTSHSVIVIPEPRFSEPRARPRPPHGARRTRSLSPAAPTARAHLHLLFPIPFAPDRHLFHHPLSHNNQRRIRSISYNTRPSDYTTSIAQTRPR